MGLVPDASADALVPFVESHLALGSVVVTDAWKGYPPISRVGFTHVQRNQRAARRAGDDADAFLPGVHRVASLFKRWLLGTHQGAVGGEHLPAYMDAFVFRFYRRRSRSRGLLFYRVLELAVGHAPVRYRELIANPQPRGVSGRPPSARGRPPSLERPYPDRPWRKAKSDKYDYMDTPEERFLRPKTLQWTAVPHALQRREDARRRGRHGYLHVRGADVRHPRRPPRLLCLVVAYFADRR